MEDFWLNKWKNNNTKWHRKEVNEFLEKHFDKYCPKVDGKLRAFVPLCGKMVDMKWLLEKGCEVVGVELVKQACDEFFQEQLMEYDLLTLEGLPVYKAKDFSLTLYNCDFFDFAKKIDIGKFHFIWDRGSLTVMSKEDKPRYASFIKKWLADDFAYLIEAPLYSSDEYQGFPQTLEFGALTELYDDTCDFLILEKVDFLEKAKKAHSPNLTSFFWCIYLLLPKKN